MISNMKRITYVFSLLLVLSVLASCSKSADSTSPDLAAQVAGDYSVSSVSSGGTTFDATQLALIGGSISLSISKIDANTVKLNTSNSIIGQAVNVITLTLTDAGNGLIKLTDPTDPSGVGTYSNRVLNVTFKDKTSGTIITASANKK
jgi:hypothetical protein